MEKNFDKAISDFFNNPDPELLKAFLDKPIIIDSEKTLIAAKGTMILPLMICDNPDSQLSNIPNQVNFVLPISLIESNDEYAKNLKKDLNMYRKSYETYSKQVNQIIDQTKSSIKKIFPSLKKFNNEIKDFSKNFENSIIQLFIPLENKRISLNDINYKQYDKEKQQEFLNDKSAINKEINNFFKESAKLCEDYKLINKNTLDQTEQLIQQFQNLSVPANELSSFMNNLFKAFEKSTNQFNDLNNKEKINKILEKIIQLKI